MDGAIEPGRWTIDKETGLIISHPAATRENYMTKKDSGTELKKLPKSLSTVAPLDEKKIEILVKAAQDIEALFGTPQDIEWTFIDNTLTILQSRPITTLHTRESTDKRPWYLSLHRNFNNLQKLREKIEKQLIPAMIKDAESLAAVNLHKMTDHKLADEIELRQHLNENWSAVYWEEFIPFAHGMRLFGQTYNDMVHPENPYEFLDLLVHSPLESLKRNEMLQALAQRVATNKNLRKQIQEGVTENFIDKQFDSLLREFTAAYGDLSCTLGAAIPCTTNLQTLLSIILELSKSSSIASKTMSASRLHNLEANFFHKFPPGRAREEARELLDIGRASYRLRDDDNIFLGKIEKELTRALIEGKKRLLARKNISEKSMVHPSEIIQCLKNPSYKINAPASTKKQHSAAKSHVKPRQLLGQPAGPGIAKGRACIVNNQEDLSAFKKDNILVCDAVEPNMTFVVPLAGGIVERRGGMLIHGAIIAREYGVACVYRYRKCDRTDS